MARSTLLSKFGICIDKTILPSDAPNEGRDMMLSHSISFSVCTKTTHACTVTTFNSCTKCVGSSGVTHDRAPDCYPVFWSWTYG